MFREQPTAGRRPVDQDGMIYGTDGCLIAPCRLRNVSDTGAQIELRSGIALPKDFLLSLTRKGQV
jgi:hypothetical protein